MDQVNMVVLYINTVAVENCRREDLGVVMDTTYGKRWNVGQSLLEAVVAVGIVILLITGLIAATTSTLRFGQMSKDRTQALQYAKEGMEIVRIIRDTNWDDIPQTTATYCLAKGARTLGGCPMDPIDAMFSRTINFSDDGTTCVAPDCRKVTITVSWMEKEERSVTLTSYITNWRMR